MGKTTLALSAAHNLREAYANGQLYADLRGSGDDPVDPHIVAGRFLRALGVEGSLLPGDRDERTAMLLSRLAGTRTLIVLDDAANEQHVRPLLPGTTGCAVLITSRRWIAALVTAARWGVPVLEAGDATRLLGRIAGVHRIEAEPEAAAAITRLCGQLPLVCVAAARLSVRPDWTLAEFEALLADERQRLDGLRIGDLDVRASIGLSYRALDADLKHLLRRLSLLSTSDWPEWAAGEAADEPDVDKLLEQLLDVHLVESAGVDRLGQHRFRLHDLIAEYAHERITEEEPEAARAKAVEQILSGWLAGTGRSSRPCPHRCLHKGQISDATRGYAERRDRASAAGLVRGGADQPHPRGVDRVPCRSDRAGRSAGQRRMGAAQGRRRSNCGASSAGRWKPPGRWRGSIERSARRNFATNGGESSASAASRKPACDSRLVPASGIVGPDGIHHPP